MNIAKLFFIITIFPQICLATPPSPAYEILDIEFINNLPFVNIQVENEKAKVLLDTGARNQVLVLKEDILSKLSTIKLFPTKEKSSDITGKEYIATKYILPNFNIGAVSFFQVRLTQDTNWGLSDDSAENILKTKDGVIGLELFINKAIIIDYPHKKLTIIYEKYPEEYDIDNWHNLDFKVDRYGLNLYLSIDQNKTKRFILDSGSNISLIKQSSIGTSEVKNDCLITLMNDNSCNYVESRNLILKHLELANMKFFLYNFQRDFEPDGIIGYDFLEDKVLYIDFNKRIMKMKPN